MPNLNRSLAFELVLENKIPSKQTAMKKIKQIFLIREEKNQIY